MALGSEADSGLGAELGAMVDYVTEHKPELLLLFSSAHSAIDDCSIYVCVCE